MLRSGDPSDFDTATCLESDDNDLVVVDEDLPTAGQAFYYLVRAVNTCGEGSLGYGSDGAERTGANCP